MLKSLKQNLLSKAEFNEALDFLAHGWWAPHKQNIEKHDRVLRRRVKQAESLIKAYLKWGSMTSSDRDLWDIRFRRFLSGELTKSDFFDKKE